MRPRFNAARMLVRRLFGQRVYMQLRTQTGLAQIKFGNYEIPEELLRSVIPRTSTVIDVGANIGITASVFRKYARKVYAFEPNPIALQQLRRTVGKYANVEIIPFAVSNAVQTRQMNVPVVNGVYYDTRAQIVERQSTEANQEFPQNYQSHEVSAITLDSFFRSSVESIALIKEDTEGHGCSVLTGAKRVISKHRPVLYLELNHTSPCVKNLIAKKRYVAYYFDSKRAYLPEQKVTNHLLLFPAEKASAVVPFLMK